MLLSLGMGGDSPEVQEGTEVVIPGEGPEQLHHFRHVLLSTRPRERGKTDWVLFGTPSHLTPTPEHPSFFPSRDHGATAVRRAPVLVCPRGQMGWC